MQEEIDKLLAPLTPSAVTPHHDDDDDENEEIDFDNEDLDEKSSTSSVSSSPFELCEIITETTALVENEQNLINPTSPQQTKEQNHQGTDVNRFENATVLEISSNKSTGKSTRMLFFLSLVDTYLYRNIKRNFLPPKM